MDRKIGLVLASIHAGLSRRVWRQIAAIAQSQGDTLFVFPGGRLSSPENYEYLRQIVYPLASSTNIQGLISWSSTLGGFVPLAEVVSFHRSFDVPFVTFGLEVPGHPYVGFDSYHGVMGGVEHCIKVHGAKHIAFIRGPQNHPGAQERYDGFVQCLKDNGISFEERLVSSPHSWSEGKQAILELLDARHLVPGKDFDTLVSSSDMMSFEAGKVLEERGYRIPQDVHMVGFNDTAESLFLRCPLTTVHMPVEAICTYATEDITRLMDGAPVEKQHVVLPMPLVIRHSCGCQHPFGEDAGRLARNLPAFQSWLGERFPRELVDRLVKDLQAGEDAEDVLYTYLKDHEGDSLFVEESISLYDQLYQDSKTVRTLEVALLRAKVRLDNEDRYENQQRSEQLNMLKNRLLCSRSLGEIMPICQRTLPALGVPGMYLVLRDNSDSLFIGGFERGVLYDQQEHFPSERVLPEAMGATLSKGTYIVEPLFMENQPLGYAVLKVEANRCEGVFLEELRTALSSAVKGTLLFEEARKAKDNAERSERLRGEFLANVNDNISGPFSELIQSATDPEQKRKMRKIMHLFELTLTHVDVDEMNYLLTSYDSLPPVFVDEETTKRMLDTLEECMPGKVMAKSYRATLDGMEMTVGTTDGTWNPDEWKGELAMGLVERLCLNQAGSLSLHEHTVTILFPWPTLRATSPMVAPHRKGGVWYLGEDGDKLPGLLKGERFVNVKDFGAVLPMVGECAAVEIDADKHSYEYLLAIHLLEKQPSADKLPVLCLHYPSGCKTILDALNEGDSMADGQAIAVLGALPSGLEKLAIPSDFHQFQDIASFESLETKAKPALCVMDRIDKDLVSAIRRRSQVPILVLQEKFSDGEVEALSSVPGLSIANTCIAQSDDFLHRLQEIISGAEMLAPLTGVLVKRGVVFLNDHATEAISRWQLAEAINVSEDYLTRIFRKDLGLSPWDYLTRLRIDIAKKLLRQTTLTVGEVASRSGFQDQAYFCRVFKKATGVNPGKLRQR